MSSFKTIYSPGTAFGGVEYRATSNGEIVYVQQRTTTSERNRP